MSWKTDLHTSSSYLAPVTLLEAACGFVSSFVTDVLQREVFVCANNNSLHAVITQWDDRDDRLLAEMKYQLYLWPPFQRFWLRYFSTNPFLQSLYVPSFKTALIMLCAIRTRVSADANFWFKGLHVCMDSISRYGSRKFIQQRNALCLLCCSVPMKYYLGIQSTSVYLWLQKSSCDCGCTAARQFSVGLWMYHPSHTTACTDPISVVHLLPLTTEWVLKW